jgi:hypothetical protein
MASPSAAFLAQAAAVGRSVRHCEEQSDEAIQDRAADWIASLRSQ